MPGLVKIGITTRSVLDRVSEFPDKFKVVAYFESSDPVTHESSVHNSLRAARIKGKEFFRVSLEETMGAVQKVTGNAPIEGHTAMSNDPRAALKNWMETPKYP